MLLRAQRAPPLVLRTTFLHGKACHWILSRLRLPTNPVPLPPRKRWDNRGERTLLHNLPASAGHNLRRSHAPSRPKGAPFGTTYHLPPRESMSLDSQTSGRIAKGRRLYGQARRQLIRPCVFYAEYAPLAPCESSSFATPQAVGQQGGGPNPLYPGPRGGPFISSSSISPFLFR